MADPKPKTAAEWRDWLQQQGDQQVVDVLLRIAYALERIADELEWMNPNRVE